MKTIIYQYYFWIPNLTKIGISPAHKLFNRPIRTNLSSIRPQPKSSTTKIATEPETQNRLSTVKPGDTVRMRNYKEKTWDKKGSVIALNALARTTS